jgi:hypothetical protein
LLNPRRGSQNAETDVFWVVSVSTGYEGPSIMDADPNGEQFNLLGLTSTDLHSSIIFLETIRDKASGPANPSANEMRARLTVHEIGHQFALAVEGTVPINDPNHRNDANNIMHKQPWDISFESFVFHAHEINHLRSRHESPGNNEP